MVPPRPAQPSAILAPLHIDVLLVVAAEAWAGGEGEERVWKEHMHCHLTHHGTWHGRTLRSRRRSRWQ